MDNTTTKQITPKQYAKAFKGKESMALRLALDIRKLEIELYWKRATYFCTFIAATMAGFIAIQASDAASKTDLSVILTKRGRKRGHIYLVCCNCDKTKNRCTPFSYSKTKNKCVPFSQESVSIIELLPGIIMSDFELGIELILEIIGNSI